MTKPYIKKIEYLNEHTKTNRILKISLSSKRIIKAVACCGSWEQWGGTNDELKVTLPIVEKHTEWLNGGERP